MRWWDLSQTMIAATAAEQYHVRSILEELNLRTGWTLIQGRNWLRTTSKISNKYPFACCPFLPFWNLGGFSSGWISQQSSARWLSHSHWPQIFLALNFSLFCPTPPLSVLWPSLTNAKDSPTRASQLLSFIAFRRPSSLNTVYDTC